MQQEYTPQAQGNITPQASPSLPSLPREVCARVVRYAQSLDPNLDPVLAISLAQRSLTRTKERLKELTPDQPEGKLMSLALEDLFKLLQEEGTTCPMNEQNGDIVQGSPPLKRSSMAPGALNYPGLRSLQSYLCKCLHRWKNGIHDTPYLLTNPILPEQYEVAGANGGANATIKLDLTTQYHHEGSAEQASPDNAAQEEGTSLGIWKKYATRRRFLLLALILFPSIIASSIMHRLLPEGEPALRVIITCLFTVLFIWISVGFWSSVAGLILILRRFDKFSVTSKLPDHLNIHKEARTALLFPIYNEDTSCVSAGIRTVLQSLQQQNSCSNFDIFILSDSTSPDAWVKEEEAWQELCKEHGDTAQIFYRRRKNNLKRKSGNIADFCRRWGATYRYMVVFDADSLMSAKTLIKMVQTMEMHPSVGILQTAPKNINSCSLIARAGAFANHLYGPIFAAGLQFWQLGDAQYWGHNAIIRVEPFMSYCQLPLLPGKAPLGGEIMSHDFVESALMRRAGYGVWLAYTLDGSYEESPPSLIDELIRDRRWCQGNLQHFRLIFSKGIFPTHRALFINGIMSYVSALLWFLFLLTSSVQAFAELFIVPNYFSEGYSLFPTWPQFFPYWALTLFSSTATLLFLPKIFALALTIYQKQSHYFGGIFAMSVSMLLEVIISTFLAPVRMYFHSLFVIGAIFGYSSGWNAQNRGDSGTSWSDAVRFHWKSSLLGVSWGILLYIVRPDFFFWTAPIVLGLALSIPLSVLTSKPSLGKRLAKYGLFLTPPEVSPSPEVQQLRRNLATPEQPSDFLLLQNKGFERAVVIPQVFALHLSLLGTKKVNTAKKAKLERLRQKSLQEGPTALSRQEQLSLLANAESMKLLHRAVWELSPNKAILWGIY